ncbi:MAG: RNA polymerase sigma factor FliA [Limnohabitans sp.]|uniref:RNA polymerase sigma factor FliA n=1 Tax=Limnohabitans sp. TaxID=1907725 RepID=UPI0025E5F22D|nr:RNA polymerase sigma factor FliA [Limnohabitans sp.]MCO4088218.1 RNA polymerase sigma factor FliA [Limnohabitans sp.]
MSINVSLYEEVGNRHESLILTHMPMVKRVAVHLKVRLPPFMELDELVQVGMVGLIEAARSFDPAKGFEFEHFALSRVRGAILDEVRRQSFLPRSAVAFNKNENEAVHVLAAELGRAPNQAELAQFMGKEIGEFHKERGQAKLFETFSMEVVNDEVMNMPADSAMQPEVMVEEAQFMEAVVQAIDQLPERERMVMSLYYVEEMNLKAIGEILGVSESRVSQILSTVVKKLRQNLKISQTN